jgi:hypothetical protein
MRQARLIGLLIAEVRELRQRVTAAYQRIADQADLLARRAERPAAITEGDYCPLSGDQPLTHGDPDS